MRRSVDELDTPTQERRPPTPRKAEDYPTGIRPSPSGGWRAWVRVEGRLRSKSFPKDTALQSIRRWRELQRVTAHYDMAAPLAETGEPTFADDARTYLGLVTAMPSFADRKRHIEAWIEIFGTRARQTLTAIMIRQQLAQWRESGRVDGKALSPVSLNLRRTALMHLFTVLDGKDARNPVRGVPPFREEEKILRLPTLEQARSAIAHVDQPQYRIKHGTQSRARLSVLLETAWPSAILKALTPADIHWADQTATVAGRKKGGGTRPLTIPLSADAMVALKAFHKLKCYGPFSGSSLRHSLHRGCQRAKVKPFRVYDLRHLRITLLTIASGDERGVAELALHTDPRQTRRYSRNAASARALAVLKAVEGERLQNPKAGNSRARKRARK